MDLSDYLKKNAKDFYNLPVDFWKPVLGNEMHYHLGHFATPNTPLEDAMRLAITNLLELLPSCSFSRVLDVGCGWGGPGMLVSDTLDTDVYGLSLSQVQVDYINGKLQTLTNKFVAEALDVERSNMSSWGKFDLFLLYEVLEHIADRESLFRKLYNNGTKNSLIAIAAHCRNPDLEKESLYNEFMGIQFLPSLNELKTMLLRSGWRTLNTVDRTELTRPVWQAWKSNLKKHANTQHRDNAKKLDRANDSIAGLYKRGYLKSVQIIACRNDQSHVHGSPLR